MRIKFLKAFNGDSILISFKDNEEKQRNILIDGGTSNTYEYKDIRTGKIKAGDLKITIETIKNANEKIDLLVLTHVDDDHIGGILKWFSKDVKATSLIDKIWFNSGRLIAEYFQVKAIQENLIKFNKIVGTNTSINQGIVFEDYIRHYLK